MHELMGTTYHYLKGFVGPGVTEHQVLNAISTSGSTADQIFEIIEHRALETVAKCYRHWYRAKVDSLLTDLTFSQKIRVSNSLEPETLQALIDVDNYYKHTPCYELTAKGSSTPAEKPFSYPVTPIQVEA